MMASSKEQILDQFEIVRRERDAAVRDLGQAQETIAVLEAEIVAVKYHADLAYAKVADEQGLSKRQIERKAEVTATGGKVWIDGIWLCSADTPPILRPAEKAWQEHFHNPQPAILLVMGALKTNLVKKDRLKCKLFMAAVQFSATSLEPACALINDCIRECGTDPRFRDMAGIAYYIRGRIFEAMKIYPNAHWDFSMAVLTKDYHDRAKKWQSYCASCILEAEGEDGTDEDLASSSEESNIRSIH